MAKNPTNQDILTELGTMNTTLQSTVKDVTDLKDWRRGIDIAKKAVDEYRQAEYRDQEQKSIMDVLKQLAPFIVALTALAYAAVQALKR